MRIDRTVDGKLVFVYNHAELVQQHEDDFMTASTSMDVEQSAACRRVAATDAWIAKYGVRAWGRLMNMYGGDGRDFGSRILPDQKERFVF